MKHLKVLLLALFAVQLAVPGYMIFEQYQILSKGTVYKFKTQPIDPYDPFRGRYVTLAYNVDANPIPTKEVFQRGDWAYALLSEDEDGYATFTQLVSEEPEAGQEYIEVEVSWGGTNRGHYIDLPFDRYYASEETAPNIERAVWRRDQVEDVYAEISVLNGKATLKELYVEDLPIREYLEQKASQAEE